jgi:hypothetical protein
MALLLSAPAARAESAPGDWLGEVNRYRVATGLDPVSEEPAWGAGIAAHLTYLARTPTSLMSGQYASAHAENPQSPYATAAGARAGSASDLALGGATTPVGAIDAWLRGPFHAIGMLRAQLSQVAFALDPTTHSAGLDILSGLDERGLGAGSPILFPGPGVVTDLRTASTGELPSALETCGWQGRTVGLPLIALLPEAPDPAASATLATPTGTLSTRTGDLCLVDENSYRSSDGVYGATGLQLLQQDRALVLIPRTPLGVGNHTATLQRPGRADVTWSFAVGEGSAGPTDASILSSPTVALPSLVAPVPGPSNTARRRARSTAASSKPVVTRFPSRGAGLKLGLTVSSSRAVLSASKFARGVTITVRVVRTTAGRKTGGLRRRVRITGPLTRVSYVAQRSGEHVSVTVKVPSFISADGYRYARRTLSARR